MGDRPYTPETLAKRWDCSAKHVRNLCASGALRAFKVSKRDYRITVAAVAAYEGVEKCELDDAKTASGTPSRRFRVCSLCQLLQTP